MNHKFFRKISSTFLALLLLVSLVTTPLSTFASAGSVDNESGNNEASEVENATETEQEELDEHGDEDLLNKKEEAEEDEPEAREETDLVEGNEEENEQEALEEEIDYYNEFKLTIDEDATEIRSDEITISWDVNYEEIVSEYVLYLDGEEVDRVEGNTASYTYTELGVYENYDLKVKAITKESTLDNQDSSWVYTKYADDEVNYREDFELKIDRQATKVTSNSITVSWDVNYDEIVEEYLVYLDDEEVALVDKDTTSYTFTDLKLDEYYSIDVEAVTKVYTWSNKSWIGAYTDWSDDELVPVSFILLVNEEIGYYNEKLKIRGLDDANHGYERDFYIGDEDELDLPIGKFEVILYNRWDYSVSARDTFEIKEDVDYINNPVQFKFKVKEMREEAEPFEYEVSNVTEDSFTLKWNSVSKIKKFFIEASNDKDEGHSVESGPIAEGATEYTLKGLNPDLIYSVGFLTNYLYDLNKWYYLDVKTDGEHAKAEKVDFENDALHQAVNQELGIHLRDATILDMDDLTYLSSNYNYDELKSLKGLELAINLERLYAYGNEIEDISAVHNLKQLNSLDLDDNNIEDIDALKDLTDLTYLQLYGNRISDINALSNLIKLDSLSLSNNKISDIVALSNLTDLTYLRLSNNEITDISSLENLTSLQDLYLSYNKISDISGLSNLTELDDLSIDNNNITDISVLANLTDLRYLYAYDNKISELPNLSKLTKLEYLDLDDNEITDISNLSGLTRLKTLFLDENNITVIPQLTGLENLTYLSLVNNKIADIAGLTSLNSLESLYLYNNEISELPDLSGLDNLTYLSLVNNKIVDIAGLTSLNNLKELYLYNNEISELPDLSGLENLTDLDLAENNISDISNLAGLQNLEGLYLDYNQITDITILKELPRLQYVSLYGNEIDDNETIQWLRNEGVSVYYDYYWEDEDWNDWDDEDEEDWDEDFEVDWDEVENSFTEDTGFTVNQETNAVSINLDESSSKENLSLSKEQVRVLVENNQKVELVKDGVTTSIPASAFANYDENDDPVEITVNELPKEPNSFSSTYDFTIKQGTRTISQFDEGITLTFNVNADRARNPQNLKVFYKNEETGKWENIGGQYDRSKGAVTVVTAHFSIFTVFEAEDEESEDIVEVEEPTKPTEPELPAEPEEPTDPGNNDTDNKDNEESPEEDSLEQTFPETDGFKVSEDAKRIIVNVEGATLNLSKEQVQVLKENNLSIVLEQTGVTTVIPASIFENNDAVVITVEKVAKVANSFSDAYNFTIKQGDKIISEFADDITLTFKVDAEDASKASNLQVFYFNEETGKWENIGGTYDAETNMVTAKTNHFSTFAVFEAEEIDSNKIVEATQTPVEPEGNENDEDEEESPGSEDETTEIEDNEKDSGEKETTELEVNETNSEVDETESDEVTGVVKVESDNDAAPTVTVTDDSSNEETTKANALPKTATQIYDFIFFGLALILAGITILSLRRFSGNKA